VRLHLHGTVLPEAREGDVFVEDDGTISFDGSAADARTIVQDAVLLPGLVDAHAHLTVTPLPDRQVVDDDGVAAHARAQLAAGVLLVREPGGASRASAGLSGRNGMPRILSAGRWLAGPGRFVDGWGREVADDELADAAVDELGAGGGWAKVIGDWRHAETPSPSFRPEVLAEAVRRVHDAGGRVAIHAIFAETVEAAVAAGCDTIEHATFASEAVVAAAVERGIAVTPTLAAVLAPPPPDAPPAARAWADEAGNAARATIRAVWEAGGVLLAGTDLAVPHGDVRREIELLASCGLPAEDALAAGSWAARAFLGMPGIEEGAPADVVAFERDPREDLSVLAEPLAIVLNGKPLGTRSV
jgi:imidazolonepropionase-like amidohydrolase